MAEAANPTLYGYHYSVYARIARLACLEKGLAYDWVEVDPFAEDLSAAYLALHPFGRVPLLDHDGFTLYETAAITRYLDENFPGPKLQPKNPRRRARMTHTSEPTSRLALALKRRAGLPRKIAGAQSRLPTSA